MVPGISGNGATDTIYLRSAAGNSVEYRVNNGDWAPVAFPGLILNSNPDPGNNPLKIILTTDLTIDNINSYFTCSSDGIQFGSETLNSDGTRPTITISGVTAYGGFVGNGSGVSGYNYVSIYNLNVHSAGSTMADGAGWVGRKNFARGASNNSIIGCSSDGDISGGGGIVGSSSAISGGTLVIRVCYSTGSILGGGGGIVGQSCAAAGGDTLNVNRCWSSGSISALGGGIYGNSCGINGGSCAAANCYSTGSIAGGGIFGASAGSAGIVSATNCYSTGAITGGGGIFNTGAGVTFGGNPGSATATNCVSTGNISAGNGGIFGSGYGTTLANHCYTSGSAAANTGGIWAGSASNLVTGANNYGEGNAGTPGWNDSHATTYLTGAPGSTSYGTTWIQPNGANTAYLLTNTGYTPYSLSFTNSAFEAFYSGNTTAAALVLGHTYTILQINGDVPSAFSYISINAATGAITTTASAPTASYLIYIYSSVNPYDITEYTLNLTAPPAGPAAASTDCCVAEKSLIGLPYEYINNIRTGSAMLNEHNTNPTMKFVDYASYVRYKMAQSSS